MGEGDKKMKIVQLAQKALRLILEHVKCTERRWYNTKRKRRLRNRDFTIIASNCNGTLMYHDLGLRYLTPTVNLAMGMDDFVKMAAGLKQYMEKDIVEVKGESGCPAGLLGDVRINFVHYDTFEEGRRKWDERKKRINWENLFIVGTEKDGCSYETLQRFDSLPYKNKVVFTHVEYPEFSSAYYIRGFEDKGELGVLTFYKKRFWRRRYLDDFDYVNFLNHPAAGESGGNKHD